MSGAAEDDPSELDAPSGEFPAGVRSSTAPEDNLASGSPLALPLGARPDDPSLPPQKQREVVAPPQPKSFERTALPQALQLGASPKGVASEREGLPRGIQQSVVGPLPTPPLFEDQTLVEPATREEQHPNFADAPDDIGTVADAPSSRRNRTPKKKVPPPVANRAPRPSAKHNPAATKPRPSVKKTMMGAQGFEPPRRLDAHRADWAEETIAQRDDATQIDNVVDEFPEVSVESVVEPAPSPSATLDYAHAPAIPKPVATPPNTPFELPTSEGAFSEPPISDHTFLKQHVARKGSGRRMAVVAAAIFALVGVAGAGWYLWDHTHKESAVASTAERPHHPQAPFADAPKAGATAPVDEPAAVNDAPSHAVAEEAVAEEAVAEEAVAEEAVAEEAVAEEAGPGRNTGYGNVPNIVSLEVGPDLMRLGFIRRRQLAGMHLRKGVKAQRQRKHQQAKAHFRRAVDYYPLQGASMRHLARYAMDEGELGLAANWAFEATKADPRHHLSWMLLGEVQEKRGEWKGAQAAYREVARLLPRHRTAKSKVRELGKKVRGASPKRARKRRGRRASRR